jgi:short-subunit dehydrogenase
VGKELDGKWALVTGASSGIGVVLAEELAARGASIVLVARRRQALEKVAERICSQHGVNAQVLAADLVRPGEPERLFDSLKKGGVSISILANNAGFGTYGTFDSIDPATEEAMIDLDIKALVRLTRLFVGPMRAAGFGHVLLTASTGAYNPGPLYSVYCAAKAFVLSYGLAIRQELRGTGVTVTVLSPGVTKTEFHQVAGHEKNRFKERTGMEAGPVGRAAIRALLRGKAQVVPGFVNKIVAFSARLAPRPLMAAISSRVMS